MLFYLKYHKFDHNGYSLFKTAYVEVGSLVELRKKLRKDKFIRGFNHIEVYSAKTAKNQNGRYGDGIGRIHNMNNTGVVWQRNNYLKGGHLYEYEILADGSLGKKRKVW